MIDSKVKILDCPGVIFDDNHKESSSILRNIIKVKKNKYFYFKFFKFYYINLINN
jgi:ribosome biogenesis GTPase A